MAKPTGRQLDDKPTRPPAVLSDQGRREDMNWVTSRYNAEPALFYGLVQAIIVLAVTFGLRLPLEQTGAILAATAIIVAFLTRQKVSPATA
jgi:hypothetical protein